MGSACNLSAANGICRHGLEDREISNTDSFHGPIFTQQHFYLVFYSTLAHNTLVYTATNDFFCMLELGQVENSQGMTHELLMYHFSLKIYI